MIKLIVSDIDGTLVNDNKEILPEVITAIQTARQQGIRVVLCSGRPLRGVQPYLNQLGLTKEDDYVVTFNGAQILCSGTGKAIAEHCLCPTDVRTILKVINPLGVKSHLTTTAADMVTTDRDISKYTVMDAFYTGMPLHYQDFEHVTTHGITKIMLADQPDILDRVTADLPEEIINRLYTVRSEKWFFEFMNPQATKGNAVLELASMWGINSREIMTVGDQENDIPMLKAAGIGVAMGNATQDVKQIADVITTTNEEKGLAKAIYQYALK